MNKFIFDVKQLKIDKFIQSIWQLIISTLDVTIEVPSLRPCFIICYFSFVFFSFVSMLVDIKITYLVLQHIYQDYISYA